jgi:hypothetical protein
MSWVLRGIVVVAGAVALALSRGSGMGIPVLVLGVVALVFAGLDPGGPAPAGVLVCVVLAWLLRYGTDPAPGIRTVGLAAVLAVHHQAAALAAVVPRGAVVDREVLARHARNLAVLVGLSGLVGVVALGLGRAGGSVPLEFLGLAAAVVAVAVPIALGRR